MLNFLNPWYQGVGPMISWKLLVEVPRVPPKHAASESGDVWKTREYFDIYWLPISVIAMQDFVHQHLPRNPKL